MSKQYLQVEKLQFLDCGPFSFSLEAGECVGISGASGVGKTQLLRALSDLIPSTGYVSFCGRKKQEYTAVQWRRLVTMLPTDSVWWFADVAAHFQAADPSFFQTMVRELKFSPEVVSWQVNRLSTGEKQRLALIRSLQIQPSVLLLDEPTSALDNENVIRVEKLLHTLRSDGSLSLMWVSHDHEQLERVCDRVLEMKKDDIHCLSDVGG